MTTTTDARRAALERFVCPDHGCPLEEVVDVDEHGPVVAFRCLFVGHHDFGSVLNPVIGYVPVDRDEEGPLDQRLRAAGAPQLPGMPT